MLGVMIDAHRSMIDSPVRSNHHSPGGARSHTYARSCVRVRVRVCCVCIWVKERECVYITIFLRDAVKDERSFGQQFCWSF